MFNPLDLPELRYHLADSLTYETRTLAVCAQVCKSWNDSFNPLVWRQLSAATLLPKGHLYRQALENNGHLIQDLTIGKLDNTRYCLDHITHLKTLQVEDERNFGLSEDPIENFFLNMAHSSLSNPLGELALFDHNHPIGYDKRNEWILQLEALLRQNKGLARLRLKMDRFEPTPRFWETVHQSCPGLVELECVFTVLTAPQMQPFLTACATTGIRSLVLQHCHFDRFLAPEVLAQHCFTSIESLTLSTNSYLDLECQLQWMRCCPNLVQLTWTLMGTFHMNVTEFCHVLAVDCPKITVLVLSDRLLEAHHLAKILDAAQGLNKFVLRGGFSDLSLLDDPQVMAALAKHYESLRELEFGQDRGHVEWASVHQILTRCVRLESLVVHGKVGIRPVVREDGDLQDATVQIVASVSEGHEEHEGAVPHKTSQSESQPWACLGLRRLQMMLSLPNSNDMVHASTANTSTVTNIPPSRDMTQQRLMEQIGRMTQLQELLLGPGSLLWMYEEGFSCYRGLDFRLEAGLGLLAGLVRLERLDVEGIQQQQMGVEDVQWMLRHWPLLRIVEGDLNYHREDREVLDRIMSAHGFLVQRGRFLRV